MNSKEQVILQRFAENVANLREKKQLSLRQMAARCELSHSKIYLIESGKVNVTLLTIVELAKGLGVSPKELLDLKV
jgi:transcriptional regulator with XRE-family HTH domain